MNQAPVLPASKRAGLIESAVFKLFTRKATVEDVEDVGQAFRILTLVGPALRDARWTPGDKVQLLLGGWTQRTYTPMEWHLERGRTRILACLHSGGPGAQWARAAHVGEQCVAFGPRTSLVLGQTRGPSVVLGDETSIGLACALGRRPGGGAHGLLEVASMVDARQAIARLGPDQVELFERAGQDAHLERIQRRLPALAAAEATFVLTGRAAFIQRLRRALKALSVPSSRIIAKPYWAPGKTGLD